MIYVMYVVIGLVALEVVVDGLAYIFNWRGVRTRVNNWIKR